MKVGQFVYVRLSAELDPSRPLLSAKIGNLARTDKRVTQVLIIQKRSPWYAARLNVKDVEITEVV